MIINQDQMDIFRINSMVNLIKGFVEKETGIIFPEDDVSFCISNLMQHDEVRKIEDEETISLMIVSNLLIPDRFTHDKLISFARIYKGSGNGKFRLQSTLANAGVLSFGAIWRLRQT